MRRMDFEVTIFMEDDDQTDEEEAEEVLLDWLQRESRRAEKEDGVKWPSRLYVKALYR